MLLTGQKVIPDPAAGPGRARELLGLGPGLRQQAQSDRAMDSFGVGYNGEIRHGSEVMVPCLWESGMQVRWHVAFCHYSKDMSVYLSI